MFLNSLLTSLRVFVVRPKRADRQGNFLINVKCVDGLDPRIKEFVQHLHNVVFICVVFICDRATLTIIFFFAKVRSQTKFVNLDIYIYINDLCSLCLPFRIKFSLLFDISL